MRWGSPALIPAIVFALALSVRLFYLNGIEAYPKFEQIKNRLDDQVVFDGWAKSIAAGEPYDYFGTEHEFAYWAAAHPGVYPQAPLYPFLIAGIYKVVGPRYDLVRAVQLILGSLTSVALYLLARRFLAGPSAFFCGAAAAFYGPFVFYESTLMRVGPLGFVVAVALLLGARLDRPTPLLALATGLTLAASVLLRANLLPFALALSTWLVLQPLKADRAARRRLIVGLATPLLIVMTINTVRAGKPAFLSSNGPYNLFLGNIHDANGLVASRTPHYDAVKASAPREEVNLVAETLRDIGQHPGTWIQLQISKAIHFFSPREIPNNLSYDMAKRTNPRLAVAFVEFHHLLPFAVLGLVLSLQRPRPFAPLHLFLVCYSAATITFFVPSRLRQPVVLVLILLTGLALQWLGGKLAERRPIAGLLLLALLATAYGLRPKPELRQVDYAMAAAARFSRGEEALQAGRMQDARRHWGRAVALNPDHQQALAQVTALPRPDAHPRAVGLCEEARRAMESDPDGALALLHQARRIDPDLATSHHYLANLHYLQQDYDQAVEYMEKAVELAPWNAATRRNLKSLRRDR